MPVIGSLLAQERAFTKLNLHGARHVLFMDRNDDTNIARATKIRHKNGVPLIVYEELEFSTPIEDAS